LGLNIGQLKQGARAILKKEGVTNPTTKQLKNTKEKAVEEFIAILFIYLEHNTKEDDPDDNDAYKQYKKMEGGGQDEEQAIYTGTTGSTDDDDVETDEEEDITGRWDDNDFEGIVFTYEVM